MFTNLSTKNCFLQNSFRQNATYRFLGKKVPEGVAKPKLPLTAYFRYMVRQRESVQQQNPQLKASDIVTLIAKQWNVVPASQKLILQKEYQTDKQAYDRTLALYKASLTPEQIETERQGRQEAKEKKTKLKKKNLAKELGRPKKPMIGFLRFAYSTTPRNSLSSVQEANENLKEKARQWNAMSDAQKKPFKDQHEAEAKVYQDQLLKWERKMITEGHDELIRTSSLKLVEEAQKKILKKLQKRGGKRAAAKRVVPRKVTRKVTKKVTKKVAKKK